MQIILKNACWRQHFEYAPSPMSASVSISDTPTPSKMLTYFVDGPYQLLELILRLLRDMRRYDNFSFIERHFHFLGLIVYTRPMASDRQLTSIITVPLEEWKVRLRLLSSVLQVTPSQKYNSTSAIIGT